jgi:glycosyltransferase involved in cell wall biosynthesis
MVTVIIPCYKYERWLDDCLLSLRKQFYRPLKIIVVHDGCENYQLKTIFNIEAGIDIINIKRADNRGVSYARNEGLDEATSGYIWFLDADDMALPDGIEARVHYLDKHPDVDMVWGNALKINEARGNWEWTYEQCMKDISILERYSRKINAQTILWRTSVFSRFGGYYEGLRSKEDKELIYRLGIHKDSPIKPKIKAKHIDADIAIYRRHPEAKHKKRVANKNWAIECEDIFNNRIKRIRREGITKYNTRFPIWA